MKKKVNLAAKLAAFEEYFSPKIVGELNDHKLELVKVKGEFVWHSHPNTDDFFLVLAGHLTIQLRDRDIELGPGELFVVPPPRRPALPKGRRRGARSVHRADRNPEHRRRRRRTDRHRRADLERPSIGIGALARLVCSPR